ncbi:MAG TPA: hypothetical protein VHL98_21475 [Microvirga sp.]|jgi:hypothetical protein|nr:hypothetical protein [Microvirga sp.]
MRCLSSLRSGAAALLILGSAPAWSQAIGSPGSFPLHEENGAATLIERTGLGSHAARMVGEFTKADIKEMCERIGWKFYSPSFPFHGTLQDRQTITICRAKEEARPRDERLYEVRANCPEGLLWNDMGYTFRRAGTDWQTLSGRSVGAEFSSGYTRVLSRQFDMLCAGTAVVAQAPAGSQRPIYDPVTTGSIDTRSTGMPETVATAGSGMRTPGTAGTIRSAQAEMVGGIGGIGGRSLIAEARARSRGW